MSAFPEFKALAQEMLKAGPAAMIKGPYNQLALVTNSPISQRRGYLNLCLVGLSAFEVTAAGIGRPSTMPRTSRNCNCTPCKTAGRASGCERRSGQGQNSADQAQGCVGPSGATRSAWNPAPRCWISNGCAVQKMRTPMCRDLSIPLQRPREEGCRLSPLT